eukprot:gnl/MRDRNA2_/MRDRNA2_74702_c0_seq3.p1 gnl/MRDRNA2_/MRDRNA2_74702_c0~~gnl/MRDRNA2_/MRDRNA2_74702_c0_seq3.p1  ORF type:complete len:203 (+),score=26.40 gnl/MRDRNA2_/MRDRNA2_74702_c0_seq3:63-671(+)
MARQCNPAARPVVGATTATIVLKSDFNRRMYKVPKEMIESQMNFKRDGPPPQLSQIPADVWASVWETLVTFYTEEVVKGSSSCCCGYCGQGPHWWSVDWSAVVSQAQTMLSPYGVGVSTAEVEVGRQRNIMKIGLRFDGASAGSHGMQAPSQVAAMSIGNAAAPVQGGKFCPKCGTNMDQSAVFCSKCGEKQPQVAANIPSE